MNNRGGKITGLFVIELQVTDKNAVKFLIASYNLL